MTVHYVMHGLVAFFLVAAGRSRQPLLTAGCVVAAGAAAAVCHIQHHAIRADTERHNVTVGEFTITGRHL